MSPRFLTNSDGDPLPLLVKNVGTCRPVLGGDRPGSDVTDAALTLLVESEQNIQNARDEHTSHVIQSITNTSVLAVRYRTRVESRWR